MSIVDELLKIDASKVEKNKGTLNLYLSKLKSNFEFKCVEIDSEIATEIAEKSLEIKKNGSISISTYEQRIQTLLLGCPDVFANESIIKHFGCVTPIDLIKKIMTKEELEVLSDFITNLGGSVDKEKAKEEIKN